MRIMGLDYGDKTVGVAISDELLLTAQPVETIQRERPAKLRKTFARIEELIGTYAHLHAGLEEAQRYKAAFERY